ncbi:hypothetical protein OC709_02215 ['Planchonia careya' phytoplasma]|nr:hypothetical protein ['Planchonia careya' phytoplasma]MDO8030313.1 hypothetical protein ['Planchonia careya' phytoplasma]
MKKDLKFKTKYDVYPLTVLLTKEEFDQKSMSFKKNCCQAMLKNIIRMRFLMFVHLVFYFDERQIHRTQDIVSHSLVLLFCLILMLISMILLKNLIFLRNI